MGLTFFFLASMRSPLLSWISDTFKYRSVQALFLRPVLVACLTDIFTKRQYSRGRHSSRPASALCDMNVLPHVLQAPLITGARWKTVLSLAAQTNHQPAGRLDAACWRSYTIHLFDHFANSENKAKNQKKTQHTIFFLQQITERN